MRRHNAVLIAGALSLLVLPFVVQAQKADESVSETFKVDPVHACVWFRINHLNIANFYGRFNEISGTFTLNAGNPDANRLAISVKTASIDTANADRDKHLRAPDYFDAEKYPTIEFRSSKFKKISDAKFAVTGELALHGVTKPLTIELEKTGAGNDPWGNHRVGLETTFTIKRSEFGMTTMLGALGDEVRLTVAVEGIRQ